MAGKGKSLKTVKMPKKEVKKKVEEEVKKQLNNKSIVNDIMNDSNIVSGKLKHCSHCDKILPKENFHKSKSKIYNDKRIHICNSCIDILLNEYKKNYNSLDDALMTICSITNTIVIKEPFDNVIKQFAKKTKVNGIYDMYLELIDKYVYDNNTWNRSYLNFESSNFKGSPFTNCVTDDSLEPIQSNSIVDLEHNDDIYEDEIVLSDEDKKRLKRKWGDSKTDYQLIWLDNREKSYYSTHDVPNDHIHRSGVITLCNLEYLEFSMLNEGEDISKILTSKKNVLTQMGFVEKKKKNANGTNAISLSTLIRQRESFSPIINEDPDFDDIDKIANVSKALAGALCATAQKESPMVEEFKNIMKDYTFDFVQSDEDDDNE